MHPSLIWLMTVAWPLEDAAILRLPPKDQVDWAKFYDSQEAGIFHPIVQTCWY